MRRALAVVRSATALGLTGAAKVLRTGAGAFAGLAGVVRRSPAAPADAALRGAERAQGGVKGAARKARDTAQHAASSAAEATEEAAGSAADTTQEAAGTAAEAAGTAAGAAASAAEQAAEGAADAAERTADAGAAAVEGAAGAVEEAAGGVDESGAQETGPGGAGAPEVSAADIAETYEERGAVRTPTSTDVPEVAHAAAPPSHVAELARGTVAQVVEAIDGLSTDELRQLLEHEQANKRRKGVLDAVEQALTP